MNTDTRTRRSVRNAGVSVLGQIVVLGLGFITRTVFLQYLGIELLGVQSLIMSLMAVASVADAGVSWALMYSLYRPLRNGDEDRVAAVVQHAARWYRWVAVGTAAVGLSVLPFLNLLVQTRTPVEHLHLYYMVALTGIVLYYPMYHRVLLLEADQKAYRTKLVTIAVNVVRSLAQIVVLMLWQDFLTYLALQAFATVVTNGIVYRHVGRHYDFLSRPRSLTLEDRRDLGSSVRAMLVYRISGLAMTNTAPIVIAAFLGAAALGYYSNYLLLVAGALMPLEMALNSVVPSVGNLVADNDGRAARRVFDEIQLLSILCYGTSATAMYFVLDDTISLWLGESYLLGPWVLAAIVSNFYVIGTQWVIIIFRSATGMFRDVRYVMPCTALLNLALSVTLGSTLGLPGVLFGTLVARLLTNVWIEPMLLFRRYLPGGLRSYVRTQLLGVISVSFICAAGGWLLDRWEAEGWAPILVGGGAAILVVPATLALIFGRSPAWRATTQRLIRGGRALTPRRPD